MTPRLAMLPLDEPRRTATVAEVAAILACDPSHVRRLVDTGELEACRIGKRALRVFLDSVAEFQARGAIEPTGTAAAARARAPERAARRSPAASAAHRAAMARLRALGLV